MEKLYSHPYLGSGEKKETACKTGLTSHATKGSRSIPHCTVAVKQMTMLILSECSQIILLFVWKFKILSQGKHVYVQEQCLSGSILVVFTKLYNTQVQKWISPAGEYFLKYLMHNISRREKVKT